MNRSEDNTCEHCRCDLPRHVVGKVNYCSSDCYLAGEGIRECLECGAHFPDGTTCPKCLPLGPVAALPRVFLPVEGEVLL